MSKRGDLYREALGLVNEPDNERDRAIWNRAKTFLSRYEFSTDDVGVLATMYLSRIRLRRAKDFAGADLIRTHLMNLGVNMQLADDEILQQGPVRV